MWAGWRLGPDSGLQGAGGKGQGAGHGGSRDLTPILHLVTWDFQFPIEKAQIYFEMGAKKRVFVSKNCNICWEHLSLSFFEISVRSSRGWLTHPSGLGPCSPRACPPNPAPSPDTPVAHPEVQRDGEGSLGCGLRCPRCTLCTLVSSPVKLS